MGLKRNAREEMVSDLDGSTENIVPVTFGIEGWSSKTVTLKLTTGQADELAGAVEIMEKYAATNSARSQLVTKSPSVNDRARNRAIREWANKIMPDLDGVTYPLKERGRLPDSVSAAYDKAHAETTDEGPAGPPADEDVPTPSVPAKRPRGRAKVS
jgi:Lsr2